MLNERLTIKALNDDREFTESYFIAVMTWKWMLESLGLWRYKLIINTED